MVSEMPVIGPVGSVMTCLAPLLTPFPRAQDDGWQANVQCAGDNLRHEILNSLSAELPVLIAGPTASGKSSLALEIASRQGGKIVNADALQVFANWRILTARPGPEEEAVAPHLLYGHVHGDSRHSVGEWLRDFATLPSEGGRLIVVGGTGLYLTALTQGLANIPHIPEELRVEARGRLRSEGISALLTDLDEATRSRIDTANPVRVLRAWEVWRATGRGMTAWQEDAPDPLISLGTAQPLLFDADRDWLGHRIDRRFDAMVRGGAVEEVRGNLARWDPDLPSSKAIGARELVEHLRGKRDLEDAVSAAKTATRRYAKRQRTWFRARMGDWRRLKIP